MPIQPAEHAPSTFTFMMRRIVPRVALLLVLWALLLVSIDHRLPAFSMVLEHLPATIELVAAATAIAVVLGLPLGLVAGLAPRHVANRAIMTCSTLGASLPVFWVGLMLIMMFAVLPHPSSLPLLQQLPHQVPFGGRGPTVDLFGLPVSFLSFEGWRYLILPAINLALLPLSLLIRCTCAEVRAAMLCDHVKFARARGLTTPRIVGVHVLWLVLPRMVGLIGAELRSLIAFAVVTESIFTWPGIGKLLIDSALLPDWPVMVACLSMFVILLVPINLAVATTHSVFDCKRSSRPERRMTG